MHYCPQCGNKLTAARIDGADRLLCNQNSCAYIFWNNPIPVVVALVRYQDKYIIARNTAWPERIFSLIAGYLEQGENPAAAVQREVKEELGLQAETINFLGHYDFTEKNQLIIAYEVHANGNLVTNQELAEIKKLTATELLQYDFRPLTITEAVIKDWGKSR